MPKDLDGNELPRPPFDVKMAAKDFGIYVREDENLLKANLVTFLFLYYLFFLYLLLSDSCYNHNFWYISYADSYTSFQGESPHPVCHE